MISYVFKPRNSFNSQFITIDPLNTDVALEGDSASCITTGPANAIVPVSLTSFRVIRAELKDAGYLFLRANKENDVRAWNDRPSNTENKRRPFAFSQIRDTPCA